MVNRTARESGLVMVRIEPGSFVMGSPEDDPYHQRDERQHPVRITRPFLLATIKVTQELYQSVTGGNPSFGCGYREEVPIDPAYP